MNVRSINSFDFCIFVLIDTWWNVNNSPQRIFCKRRPVLIDTWWNVNVRDEIIFDFENRFNRYMVECEY